MNDSTSINSSSYSSSSASNSNSNSLNRSLFVNQTLNSSVNTSTNSSSSCGNTTTASSSVSSSRNSGRYGHVLYMMDDYLPMALSMTPGGGGAGLRRRRTKSQTMNIYGDEVNTVAEHNKQLIEDLMMLKRQLREKDEVILKLNEIRNNLESEIQELSASLFEEAYAMVNEARAESAQSDKLLKEANGKIEVLQAEVKALKELVLTSTPSTPNKHLHPQLSTLNGGGAVSRGGHSRQSSLNSQALNNIIQQQATSLNGSAASSVTGSNSNLNQPSNVSHLVVPPPAHKIQQQQSLHPSMLMTSSSSSSIKESNGKTLTHSSTSVQPLSTIFNKVHKRAPSQNDIAINNNNNKPISFIDKLFQTTTNSSKSAKNLQQQQQQYYNNPDNYSNEVYTPQNSLELPEFDPIYFKELVEWKEVPELQMKGSFMQRIYDEDILPCLSFNDKKVSTDLLTAIETNSVSIEELTNSQQCAEAIIQVCGLSSLSGNCQFKIKLSESSQWIYISRLTRNRVISVCDFFTYLRYIKDGLVKSDIHEIYWNIIDLRRKMSLSRLGL